MIAQLQARLAVLADRVTGSDLEAYRSAIEDLHRRGEANYEFLPGLRQDLGEAQCHETFSALQKATYLDFAEDADGDLDSYVGESLMALQNRINYARIHQGRYSVARRGSQITLRQGARTLVLMAPASDEADFGPADATVSFYLSGVGETLQRIAHIDLGDRTAVAWIGGKAANPFAALEQTLTIFEQSGEASSFVESRVSGLLELYRDQILSARREGCLTGRTIVLQWLADQHHFFCCSAPVVGAGRRRRRRRPVASSRRRSLSS